MYSLVIPALLAAFSTTLTLGPARAQLATPPSAPRPAAPPAYLIRDITIIDPEAGKAFEHYSLVVEGPTITAIRDGSKPPPLPKGTQIIEGAGLFLIPGLFDAHVHYIDPDTYGPLMLAHGVTFVRDLGGATEQILQVRDRLRSGELVGPDMIATGAIIDGDPPTWPFSEPCDTPEEGVAAVAKLADAGVDQIKVYSGLKPDVYRAVVKAAHERGLKATGHIPESVTVEEAIDAGQDCNEHQMALTRIIAKLVPSEERGGYGAREGLWSSFAAWRYFDKADKSKLAAELAKIKASGMHQCPTLVVMHGIGSMADIDAFDANPMLEFVPDHIIAFWEGGTYGGFAEFASLAVKPMQGMVREMHKAGIPLMVGTDLANAGVFAGSGVHDEMLLWQEAGIPAADILRSATTIPAAFCGVADRYGSVKPGKAASFVLLTANPLDDIRNARKIHGVFHRGAYHDRAALDGLLAGVKDHIAAAALPAGGDAANVELTVPGKVLHRGTYKFKWGAFDAGSEDFIVSQTDDGYHVKSHFKPLGGFQSPSITWMHLDNNFKFREASWSQLTAKPLNATYTLDADGATVVASATSGEKTHPEKRAKLPEAVAYAIPSTVIDVLMFKHHSLEPGQSKKLTGFGFGFPSWDPVTSSITLSRLDDGTFERAGAQVPMRLYESAIDAAGMKMTVRYWVDESGMVIKSVTKMPFGTLETQLE
ncbi:MAG: amidohydrolase family protein [Phycisphaerales bacterium]|nr:amidohydrolase family protein [Phycisphaerales bacterium]